MLSSMHFYTKHWSNLVANSACLHLRTDNIKIKKGDVGQNVDLFCVLVILYIGLLYAIQIKLGHEMLT